MADLKKAGMQVVVDTKKAIQQINALDDTVAKAESYTIKDVKKRVPGMVSTAVAKVYNIKKSEVAACQKTQDSKGRFKGKASVSTSFKGESLDGMTITFRGRKHANWSTKAKPKPKPRGNKVFSTKKKYAVTQTVFRGKPVTISPSGGRRAFVMNRGGKLVPMIVGNSNKPRVKASTSVPQAVMNEQVVATWSPQLNDFILKRYTNHLNRFSKKL